MSNATNTAPSYADGTAATAVHDHTHDAAETKASFKTTELVMFIVVAVGIIIAAAVVGNGKGGGPDPFNAYQAAQLIAFLTIGYMVARGLAKSGSRQPRN